MSSSATVATWPGAERPHQSFVFDNTAVEIKSLSGAAASGFRKKTSSNFFAGLQHKASEQAAMVLAGEMEYGLGPRRIA